MGSPAAARDADFGCRGARTAPASGAAATFGATVHDLQFATTTVADARVELYPDNRVAGTCSGACVATTSDASGMLRASLPRGGWFAYRIGAGAIIGSSTSVSTAAYGRIAPLPGGSIELSVVSRATLNVIPTLFMRTRVADRAVLIGTIVDCAGEPVRGAVVQLFQGDHEIASGPGAMDTFFGYFNGSRIPAATATYTNYDGVFAGANLPPSADASPVRVELRGVVEEGAEPVLLACEEVGLFGDGVSLARLEPLRSDYGAAHSCDGRD